MVDLARLGLHPTLAQVVRVVGDREELVAAVDGAASHLLHGVVPVRRPRRVGVQVAFQPRGSTSPGSAPGAGGLESPVCSRSSGGTN